MTTNIIISANGEFNSTFTVAVYKSFVNQIPSTNLIAEPVVYEVEETPNPSKFSVNAQGEFTFLANNPVTASIGFTVGRLGAGNSESIWIFAQNRVSQGPDVWVNAGSPIALAETISVTQSITFPFVIARPNIGDTFRIMIEPEDASEQMGVFSEPALGSHDEVPSVNLSLQFWD